MTVTILTGDCRDVLSGLGSGSAAACVTSVPYWQKRDYGHDAQLGTEDRPESLVTELVGAFREVRRILIPGGALWLNIADSYAAGGNGGGGTLAVKRKNLRTIIGRRGWRKPPPGFKNKDLVLVSFMLAEALRQDGWWLRKTIVWSKPAASEPPRADRPSVSHEFLFLLASAEDCTARDPGEPWWKSSVWQIAPSIGVKTTEHLNLTISMADHPEFFERCPNERTDGEPHRLVKRRYESHDPRFRFAGAE